eukprot:g3868.t1
MKKFWQSSSFQSGNLLDTVSGIVKQNAAKLTTVSTNSVDQKQYLRLPLESARRLRWYDSLDLNQIVRSHIREKQELIELNNLLRKILVDKNLVNEEVIDGALLRRMTEIDNTQVINESVASALLISIQSELTNLKAKSKTSIAESIKEEPEETDLDTVCVSFNINENAELPVVIDIYQTTSTSSRQSRALLECIQDLKTALNRPDQLNSPSPLHTKARNLLELMEQEFLFNELKNSHDENKKLNEIITVLKQREKRTQLPSEMVTQAQNMCLEAEEETRAAQKQAQIALTQAAKAEEREKLAMRETQEAVRKLSAASDHIKKLKLAHQSSMEEANEDYQSKLRECETLVQRNISLRNEIDDLNLKLVHFNALVSEKDTLAAKVLNLEDGITELSVRANRGEHYKQIANEMEERVTQMEKELLTSVQQITTLEKKLQISERSLTKEQTRSEKLEIKLRKCKIQEEEEKGSKNEANEESSSVAMEAMKQSFISELEEQKSLLHEAKEQNRNLEQSLEIEQTEKLKLLTDLSVLEDRFLTLEKNHTSSSIHLRHQLSLTKNDLEDCKKYVSQLENERQSLCKKLHVKPDPRIGFEDSRGSGTFGDVTSMSDVSNRNGLSAIDTLYLKNVLFKFIEATAKQKSGERDMLLPAVATLLGASREEFNRLKKALDDASKESKGMFSLWTPK